MTKLSRELQDLADSYGVQTQYEDVHQRLQSSRPEAVIAVLAALGAPVSSSDDIPEAIKQRRNEVAAQTIQPVIIAWQGRINGVDLRLPKNHQGLSANFLCELEDGTTTLWASVDLKGIHEEILHDQPTRSVRATFEPQQLPLGYHRLRFESAGIHAAALLIAAPTTTYSPSSNDEAGSKKRWGLFTPAYAVHSERSWGGGSMKDLERLWNWMADLGGSMVATLPLLAAFLDGPCDISPYAPVSRSFWNEFYIDVESVPELEACQSAQALMRSDGLQNEIAALRQQPLVDYRRQIRLQRQVLEELSEFCFASQGPRRDAIETFMNQRAAVGDYAAFRATVEQRRQGWHAWPEPLHGGEISPSDYDPQAWRYHVYAQWIAQQQIDRLSAASRRTGSGLYLDLPLGVHRAGYDTWRQRDVFALNASGGAPPDAFFTKGQNWGFAPLHPERLRQQEYRHFIDVLRTNFRHCDMLRIDHVMQFHRLYWVPSGMEAKDGVYVQYPADELYAIICLESHRQGCTVVGENLGTVPPYVNDAMKRHRLRQMYVVQYENNADRKPVLPEVPHDCVASVNTHDTATFAAYWQASDLDLLHSLELFDDMEIQNERKDRRRDRDALVRFLGQPDAHGKEIVTPPTMLDAVHHWLAASDAELMLINIEDLWLETEPQNTPGTGAERPNWQRKLRHSLEEIESSAEFASRLRRITEIRQQTIRQQTIRQQKTGTTPDMPIKTPREK